MEELFKSGKMDRCNFLKPCKTVSKDFHKTAASFLIITFTCKYQCFVYDE